MSYRRGGPGTYPEQYDYPPVTTGHKGLMPRLGAASATLGGFVITGGGGPGSTINTGLATAVLAGALPPALFSATSHLRETNGGNEINLDADGNASIVGGGAQTVLLANAKWDGTNYNRLNTGAAAARVVLGLTGITLSVVAAGANPIAWPAATTLTPALVAALAHLRETNGGNEINIDADSNASIVGGGAQVIQLANAKFDGTNYNRLNTGAAAYRWILGTTGITVATVGAGANPITWGTPASFAVSDVANFALLSSATSAPTPSTLMKRNANGYPDGGAWQTPTLSTNWSNFGGGWANAAYRQDANGRINLRGMIKKSIAVVGGETLFTLFSGFRPPADEYFPIVSNAALGTITVAAAGTVSLQIGNAAYVSLSGISFDTV